jgi:hypothetical protein
MILSVHPLLKLEDELTKKINPHFCRFSIDANRYIERRTHVLVGRILPAV